LQNGTEIAGSQIPQGIGALTGQIFAVSTCFLVNLASTDILSFQIASSSTLTSMASGNGMGTTKPSCTVTINLI
jgi:hypothetical protein